MVEGKDDRVNAEGDLVREVLKISIKSLFAQVRTLPLRGIVRGGCKLLLYNIHFPVDIHHSLSRSHFNPLKVAALGRHRTGQQQTATCAQVPYLSH